MSAPTGDHQGSGALRDLAAKLRSYAGAFARLADLEGADAVDRRAAEVSRDALLAQAAAFEQAAVFLDEDSSVERVLRHLWDAALDEQAADTRWATDALAAGLASQLAKWAQA